MRQLWLLALAAILITGCGDTTETAKKPKADPAETPSTEPAETTPAETAAAEPTPAEAFTQLKSEFQEARQEYTNKIRSASPAERRQIMQENPVQEFVAKFVEFAEEHGDSEVAFEAWNLVAENAPGEEGKTAITKLIDHDPNSESLLTAITRRARGPNPDVEKWLNTLIEKSTDDKVRGSAMLSLANYINTLADYASLSDDPRFVAQMPEIAAYLKNERPADESERVTTMLNEIVEKYADIPFGRSTLGEEAEGALFVINHLSIGKEAPDIEAADLDGEEFKLSDYRGKVVMLDFWGDW